MLLMQTHRRSKTTEVEVMKEVAMSVINSNSRVIVNNSVSFSTELLLLFSPVVRGVLGSIQTPDTSHSLYISATTTTTLVRIREILINIISGNQQEMIGDSNAELESALSMLGIITGNILGGDDVLRAVSSSPLHYTSPSPYSSAPSACSTSGSPHTPLAQPTPSSTNSPAIIPGNSAAPPISGAAPPPTFRSPSPSITGKSESSQKRTILQKSGVFEKETSWETNSGFTTHRTGPSLPHSVLSNSGIEVAANSDTVKISQTPKSLKQVRFSLPYNRDTKPTNSNGINYELECHIKKCGRFLTLVKLQEHCARHFLREIKSKYRNDDLTCEKCGSNFKTTDAYYLHIACKHGKLDEILREKGLAVLPCPVTSNNGQAMQKKLQAVKEERHKKEDPIDSIRQQLLEEDDDFSETSNKENFEANLDEILKKYKS